MAWHKLKPQNIGGGRKRALLNARLDKSGQLYMTHAVADMLGDPERVLVEVEPEKKQIKLAPTTPDDTGAFALSGGGNASHRIRLREITARWPNLVGNYQPHKFANAVVFVFCEED